MVSALAHSDDNDAQMRCHQQTHVDFEPLELEQVRSKQRFDVALCRRLKRFVLLC